jgi:peptidyl-prolyl cis-trans isomerase D
MSRGFKWIRNGALVLVIAAFVLLYGPGQGGVGQGNVAEVAGEVISRDIFEIWRERHARALSETRELEPNQLRNLIDSRTLNTLVQRHILAREAQALGLQVPNATLRRNSQVNPQFQTEGAYDPELVELAAARLGFSTRQYLEELRMDLLLQDFERLITSPVRLSEAQARAAIEEAETTLRLRYAVAEASAFRDGIELDPEATKEFLDTQTERIEAAYSLRRDEFRKPEQAVARHILFTGPDAQEQAATARERLDQGEGFADLALELSQDAATRDQAGFLGAFPRGRMLPAFEEAAFALEPGEVSAPVETERGVHLILLEAREAAVSRSLENVAPQLAHEFLLEERAIAAARDAAEGFLARLGEGEPFVGAAEGSGLRVGVTALFRLVEPSVAELAGVEGALEAAHSLRTEEAYVPQVFRGGDSFYAISLLERNVPEPDTVDGQVEAVLEQLTQLTRANTTQIWLEDRSRALEERGQLRVYDLYPGN